MNEVSTGPDEMVAADAPEPVERPDNAAAGGAAPGPERVRAAGDLDLWARHVGDTAAHGKGISAPWFAR